MDATPENREQLARAIQRLRESEVWEDRDTDRVALPDAIVKFSRIDDVSWEWTVTLLGGEPVTGGTFATMEEAKRDAEKHLRDRIMGLHPPAGSM